MKFFVVLHLALPICCIVIDALFVLAILLAVATTIPNLRQPAALAIISQEGTTF